MIKTLRNSNSYLKLENKTLNILIFLKKKQVKLVRYVTQDKETLEPSFNLASCQPPPGLPQAFTKCLLEEYMYAYLFIIYDNTRDAISMINLLYTI